MATFQDLAAHYNAGRFGEAVAAGEALLRAAAPTGPALAILAASHYRLGDLDKARARFVEALALQPNDADTLVGLGVALRQLGEVENAIEQFRRATSVQPHNAVALINLGAALMDLRKPEDALACYRQAIGANPTIAEAHAYYGVALRALGQHSEAVNAYARALQINPNYADALNFMGNALLDIGRRDDAIACYQRALTIEPAFAGAHYSLGVALRDAGRRDEAIAAFSRTLELKPDHGLARAQRLYQQAHICDWDGIAEDASALATLGITGDPISPFSLLSLDDSPARHRIRAERLVQAQFNQTPLPVLKPPAARKARLRIGYFSADLHAHATMHLAAKLFEIHDRERFEVRAFSYGAQPNDAMHARARSAFDAFHDVQRLDDRAIAEAAYVQGIDIAIDLKGHTQRSRPGIFAYRAAPIQISWLGFPGTTGAPFIDYLIADPILIPAEQREHYSESIIYLPHTYQVTDNSREIADVAISRHEAGLPEAGFVFCCFNNNYKITPAEFDIWMRLLRQVDGSVLWLLKGNAWSEANLRREARKRGVDPARLVFAPLVASAEHLARHQLADLFLDTFNCNAHTTASDALWTGLPVVTKLGESLVARVAGSLLAAVGLPELVAATEAEYEALAAALADDPDKLAALRAKVLANRATTPLFNTELFAVHIEAAYAMVYQHWLEGRTPGDLRVDA